MLLKIAIILLISTSCVISQSANCFFGFDETSVYTCILSINNPNGFDNFTSIGGVHFGENSDDDVINVLQEFGSSSINVPSIICEKFNNAESITLSNLGIQTIGVNSFRNCRNLRILNLFPNTINEIHEDAFVENVNLTSLDLDTNRLSSLLSGIFRNQVNLVELDLRNNQIEDLPRDIFTSLTSLSLLLIFDNKLKTLHSDSFGLLPNFRFFLFFNNDFNAFDERIVDNTGIRTIWAGPNPCVSKNRQFTDNTDNRTEIRDALSKCFENYIERDAITTTTEPYQCDSENMAERVCNLEIENNELRAEIEDMRNRIEVLESEKQGMWDEFEGFSARLRILENSRG